VPGADAAEELLNVYDAGGRVIGARRRAEAKASGLAVGAVNVLLAGARGDVLLQRRLGDKENGGLWDKTVGGHVAAGEDFDRTAIRETGEELFEDARSPLVRLAPSAGEQERLVRDGAASRGVVFHRTSLHRNLRDVRHVPAGGFRNVVYHVAVYLGRTDLPLRDFHPQASEIAALRYFDPAEVDRMLLAGELAPNMAFLWLGYARPLLDGAGGAG
jgi:isopentenyldiphosphate isomerase